MAIFFRVICAFIVHIKPLLHEVLFRKKNVMNNLSAAGKPESDQQIVTIIISRYWRTNWSMEFPGCSNSV